MKRNLLITLIACLCAASTVTAEVVYEPLIVDSGFNRDVIAETYPVSTNNCISYLEESGTTYSMATQNVIDIVNRNRGNFSPADLAISVESGWPDDWRDTIKCVANGDAYRNTLYKDVFWLLAPYDRPNVLTIRPDNAIGGTGTLKFKKIGSYSKVFFLMATAKKYNPEKREVSTTVHYTDGTSENAIFSFAGLSGQEGHNVRMINIYEGYYNKNTSQVTGKAFATVFDMSLDKTKLVDKIVFKNEQNGTAVMIFAITGVTANVPAPDANPADPNRAPLRATEITQNSISVEWDAVEGAESYRIDVATDEDFHDMVEGFNNEAVITSPDTVIGGLDADQEYYWRIRAVDSEGGQSASSAPRRVRTESASGPKETNDDNHSLKTEDITPLLGITTNLTINRKLYKDGFYNTICLPFDQSKAELETPTNPLYGFTVYEFDYAETRENNQLDIHASETDHITAGIPYLLEWPVATNEIINSLEFKGVTITEDEGQRVGAENQVQFVGNIATTGNEGMPNGSMNHLFIGANNILYWPNTSNGMKGFRAHFEVPAEGPASVPVNSPARIVTRVNITTSICNTATPDQTGKKILENGQVLVVRNGKKYNVLGQIIK